MLKLFWRLYSLEPGLTLILIISLLFFMLASFILLILNYKLRKLLEKKSSDDIELTKRNLIVQKNNKLEPTPVNSCQNKEKFLEEDSHRKSTSAVGLSTSKSVTTLKNSRSLSKLSAHSPDKIPLNPFFTPNHSFELCSSAPLDFKIFNPRVYRHMNNVPFPCHGHSRSVSLQGSDSIVIRDSSPKPPSEDWEKHLYELNMMVQIEEK